MREPAAFLFDEPLSNLDAALRVGMRLEIMELHEKLKTTMIYVTHDQVEAMTMADKIVVLQAGVIEQVGSPLDLYHAPRNRFVAGFHRLAQDEPDRRAPRPPSTGPRPSVSAPSILASPRRTGCGKAPSAWRNTLDPIHSFHVHETGLTEMMTVRISGDIAARHGDTIYLTPEADKIHKFRCGRPADRMSRTCAGNRRLSPESARAASVAVLRSAFIAEGCDRRHCRREPRRGASRRGGELGEAAYAVNMDVTDQDSIDAAIGAVIDREGKARHPGEQCRARFDAAETVDITRDSYERLYAVNVAGTLFTMQAAAARRMIAQGHGGKIINMASQAGRRGEGLVLVYCSTQGRRYLDDAVGGPQPDFPTAST